MLISLSSCPALWFFILSDRRDFQSFTFISINHSIIEQILCSKCVKSWPAGRETLMLYSVCRLMSRREYREEQM